jgi:hypothetical protein
MSRPFGGRGGAESQADHRERRGREGRVLVEDLAAERRDKPRERDDRRLPCERRPVGFRGVFDE